MNIALIFALETKCWESMFVAFLFHVRLELARTQKGFGIRFIPYLDGTVEPSRIQPFIYRCHLSIISKTI